MIGNCHCTKSGGTKIATCDRTTYDKPARGHQRRYEQTIGEAFCDKESNKSSWKSRRTVSCNEAASTGEALIVLTSRWILDQTCNPESL